MHPWVILLLVLAWPVSGAVAFIYDWTRKWDLTLDEVALLPLAAIGGPLMALAILIERSSWDGVLIRRKPE
ncbi:hypothetical protein [Burkholderia savannae]|uniref:hypothetical protein n=1 Tax=Burkholderia savannae TaxID=1637837 RepID=UPI000A8AA324|nr:hypothetical protein [Burkholderia savannae]